MPPKPDVAEAKYIYMKVTGGDPASPAVLAPKLGPLGMVRTLLAAFSRWEPPSTHKAPLGVIHNCAPRYSRAAAA